ncbi:MAG: hypothetical protein KDC98_07715, partial [Planctomycetes bacterium]|nr:hypothetical protein [Planctomycetota bacterium]
MHRPLALATALIATALAAQAPPVKVPEHKVPDHKVPEQKTPTAAPQPPSTSTWFSQLKQTTEAAEGVMKMTGTFPFRNPHQEEIEWRDFSASCACSHLEFTVGTRRYWLKPKPRELVQIVAAEGDGAEQRVPVAVIPVHGGESGTVEVHVELNGKIFKKSVLVDIHSSDATEPQTRLNFEVNRTAPIVVTPPEVDLGNVPPDEQREFTVEVVAAGQKELEIGAPPDLPSGVKVECTKVTNNGIPVWTIHGTYGPYKLNCGGPVLLKFTT